MKYAHTIGPAATFGVVNANDVVFILRATVWFAGMNADQLFATLVRIIASLELDGASVKRTN